MLAKTSTTDLSLASWEVGGGGGGGSSFHQVPLVYLFHLQLKLMTFHHLGHWSVPF